ncbi:RIP metalloprotease RseP [Cytophagales bacterium LB-30]|uniref:Zinc metalloprotease n=1 Tax=Shiella aurantiaca TaxID=3058365 RepID=A0ABT8F7C9_9BACT|nr:RIP metalloprotease RseP [Shiella aurantiaca]MDN4166279.1 RIP metalloprotease RseP [Shiella aurantiaca]
MDALVMTGQLLLGLSILVGLHELGHLLAAKAFGMRVEKFYIGFPPKIIGRKFGETEYAFGAIPLGGFVKITGMVDESLDTKNLSAEPEPWEFRAKPAWQRLIVMLGGIIMNVITGIIIFVAMVYHNGESYIAMDEVNKNGIVAYPLATEIGLRTGDKIVKINGQEFEKFSQVTSPEVLLGTNSYYTVLRNGAEINIVLPPNMVERLSDKEAVSQFIEPMYPFTIAQIAEGSNAEKGGLQVGDKVIRINGTPVNYYHEAKELTVSNAGKSIDVVVLREGNEVPLNLEVTPEGTLGYYPQMEMEVSRIQYSFLEALPKGTEMAFSIVWVNVKAFGKMFSGDISPSKSLSGPIGIAKIFGATWDWANFWRITGLLSMVLAFMNLLPIPALDGGHVVFLTYEIVSGRKPSDRFLENAQKVGMVLLLSLMVFAFYNDIAKFFQ